MQWRSCHAYEVASDSSVDHSLLGQTRQFCIDYEHADSSGEEDDVLASLVEVAIEVMLVVD